ncbi:flavin reductase family protein [Nesterenkonia massiliensis]|uniref:Flavin reductase family protein n=1 Tax=Nesterenkonia massiliensis TaxID=1232429 RepID=A0ABT2HNL9_9MICC|nr:flavin reductase family protein [Nesterenkonia massiliensis]MCT1606280.1 flavin reductase family protein [Nesterenkonia massiliensis]
MTLSAATLAHPNAGHKPSSDHSTAHNSSSSGVQSLDSLQLRRAFAQFPQGVVVVAAHINGAPEGLVASTFTVGVSLEPALVTFAVQHSSNTWPRLREGASHLGVSVIGADHHGLCRQIASKDRAGRFTGVDYTTDDGALLLDGAPLWLKTRVYNEFTAGDHDIVVLEVLDLGLDEQAPGLVFHRSEFKPLSEAA